MNTRRRNFIMKILSSVMFMTFLFTVIVYAGPTRLTFFDLKHGSDKNGWRQGYVWYANAGYGNTIIGPDGYSFTSYSGEVTSTVYEKNSDWEDNDGGVVMFWKPLQDQTLTSGDLVENNKYVIWDSFPINKDYINRETWENTGGANDEFIRDGQGKFKLFETNVGNDAIGKTKTEDISYFKNSNGEAYLTPVWGNLTRHPVMATQINVEKTETLCNGKVRIKGVVINNTPYDIPIESVKVGFDNGTPEKATLKQTIAKGFTCYDDPKRVAEFYIDVDFKQSYSITNIELLADFSEPGGCREIAILNLIVLNRNSPAWDHAL